MLRSLAIIVFVCGIFIHPYTASAAVIISEIAWMGTANSANDEWIELQNTGSDPVSLDGWNLSDGTDLTIALSGTIAGGAYAVLERTDDSSAPGSAFLVYTGALANGGATLALTRADGSIEDQVSGGTDWENVGGDNGTKHTPQYAGGGWITNEPTPGAVNKTVTVAVPEEEKEETAATSSKQTTTSAQTTRGSSGGAKEERVQIIVPDPDLELTLVIPTRAHVNQPLTFKVDPEGISDRLLDSVKMEWNFGDTNVAHGRDVSHTYAYPGEYAVVVRGVFAHHEEIVMRKIIVLPVQFSLTYTNEGALQINNDAPYEIDLSGYALVAGKRITFPSHSILLPRATVTVSPKALGYARTRALLYDTEMKLVATSDARPDAPERSVATRPTTGDLPASQVAGAASAAREAATAASSFLFGSEAHAKEVSAAEVLMEPAAAETKDAPDNVQDDPSEEVPTIPSTAFPYLGLIGLLALGTSALFLGRKTPTI